MNKLVAKLRVWLIPYCKKHMHLMYTEEFWWEGEYVEYDTCPVCVSEDGDEVPFNHNKYHKLSDNDLLALQTLGIKLHRRMRSI